MGNDEDQGAISMQTDSLVMDPYILKIYSTECVHAGIVNADEKTFRKWVWFLLKELCKLELVCSFYFIFQI